MVNRKILLGLTTITEGAWRNKIKEIDELGLKEIALFPTSLNQVERQELYGLLEKIKLEKIPHAHLRSDMGLEELKYLEDRFGVEVFNVHSASDYYAPTVDYKDYYKKIYVENTPGCLPTENDLKKYAGLCLDLAHWESARLLAGEDGSENKTLANLAEKYPVGVIHIGGINREINKHFDKNSGIEFFGYDDHYLKGLGQLDYVKKYKKYLADIICIELENTLKEQIEIKKYLEKILEL